MSSILQATSIENLSRPEIKLQFNEEHFTKSAPRYDIATILLSLGRDSTWKQYLVNCLPPFESPKCLDLACGTGDITFALATKYPKGEVIGLDLTEAMLEVARIRNQNSTATFCQGDMCRIEFPDSTFDIVTGSYALRNAPELSLALSEIYRVLKPGGVAVFLDFSKPNNKILQGVEYWLLKLWGSFWGLALHADTSVHGYISSSLALYPDRLTLQKLFQKSGFMSLFSRQFFGGITEINLLSKPNQELRSIEAE